MHARCSRWPMGTSGRCASPCCRCEGWVGGGLRGRHPPSPPLPPLQGAREALAGYPTSIAQDLELLRGATLAKGSVEETALLVRSGENLFVILPSLCLH